MTADATQIPVTHTAAQAITAPVHLAHEWIVHGPLVGLTPQRERGEKEIKHNQQEEPEAGEPMNHDATPPHTPKRGRTVRRQWCPALVSRLTVYGLPQQVEKPNARQPLRAPRWDLLGTSEDLTRMWVCGDRGLHRKRLLSVTMVKVGQTAESSKGDPPERKTTIYWSSWNDLFGYGPD